MAGMNKLGRNVVVSDDAVLGQGITIGNNVTIYPGVRIRYLWGKLLNGR